MRPYFFCAFFLFGLNIVKAQNAVDFLVSYNEHIDPLGKLDTIRLLTMQIKSEIKYILNDKKGEMNWIRSCEFHSDGTRKCTNLDDGTPKDMEILPVPNEYLGNVIKYQLNFIPIDKVESFSFKTVNDSITVIEKDFESSGKQVYTFDSKTKNLLQLVAIRLIQGTSSGYTNFQSYQTVNGIVVPRTITFSNNFSSATLEYQAVEFK